MYSTSCFPSIIVHKSCNLGWCFLSDNICENNCHIGLWVRTNLLSECLHRCMHIYITSSRASSSMSFFPRLAFVYEALKNSVCQSSSLCGRNVIDVIGIASSLPWRISRNKKRFENATLKIYINFDLAQMKDNVMYYFTIMDFQGGSILYLRCSMELALWYWPRSSNQQLTNIMSAKWILWCPFHDFSEKLCHNSASNCLTFSFQRLKLYYLSIYFDSFLLSLLYDRLMLICVRVLCSRYHSGVL